MSSATASTIFEAPRVLAGRENVGYCVKLSALILFGSLVLVQSLYLAMCYITFDFFGALASPFFAWLRRDAGLAHFAYLPLLVVAVVVTDLGLGDAERLRARRLTAIFIAVQLTAGFLLFLSQGRAAYFAWPLLFGPHTHVPGTADTQTFWESVASLIPLGWICIVNIASASRSHSRERISFSPRLAPFLMAGLLTSLLYQIAARVRMGEVPQPFSLAASGFGVVACIALFTAVFVVTSGIRVLSNLLPNPQMTQFIVQCAGIWLIMALVLRKIVFALLGFSSSLADWYAGVYSLAVVLFGASVILNFARRPSSNASAPPRRKTNRWTTRILALSAWMVCFFCSVKVSAIDWAHVLSSLSFVAASAFLLWFCFSISKENAGYAVATVMLLTVADLAALTGVRMAAGRPNIASEIEQYSVYDPSLFVIHTLFKPALQDEKYAAWYAFLNDHASIRNAIEAPSVPLTPELHPATGNKPNIFMFVIDALRRDYVSAYNPNATFTPHVQEFANDSIVFQHAYSSYAGTSLADPAIFSGFQQINKTFPQPLTRENNLQAMLDTDGYDCYVSHNSVIAALTTGFRGIKLIDTEEFGSIVQQLEGTLAKRKDPSQPIFVYTQPANVHTLFLAWHSGEIDSKPHPGFDEKYASAVERVDGAFGDFISFLKKQGLYDNSIIIVTADHGESLGEMGRASHVSNVTPEVIRVPLIIHVPERFKSSMVWNTDAVVMLHDITPTLYYLLGHRPISADPMVGRPLLTKTLQEQEHAHPDHYLLMSGYQAVFGILSADQKKLFMTDAVLHRNAFYDLEADPQAFKNRATTEIVEHYRPILRQDLEDLDKFYGVSEQQFSH